MKALEAVPYMSSMFWDKLLRLLGFCFVPVTCCVSLQAFAWNSACPLLWGHEMPRKRGAKGAEKSYKHHLDAYDGIASIINSYSQISHQICNCGGNQ